MQEVKNIIIGFGKAGKTLAALFGQKGEATVLIEQSPVMYGGTCINVGCIPSKFLITQAERRRFSEVDPTSYYQTAIQNKKTFIHQLNQANYNKVDQFDHVTIVDGRAHFVDEHTVAVDTATGEQRYTGERIFINTGATPFIPAVPGLELSERIHTSETLMNLDKLPETLTIIGSGFIGLEFASMYQQFGSQVTVIDTKARILPREDEDVAEAVKERLEELGVQFIGEAELKQVDETKQGVTIRYNQAGTEHTLMATHVLVSTGRRANVAELALNQAEIALSERGTIPVNETLQTAQPHIFALGDVNGGPQFTYVSLDDFRVIKNFLYGDGTYTTNERMSIATATFISPPLAQVGLSEKQAKARNLPVQVAKLSAQMIPKAKILGDTTGFYKILVHKETKEIVGATLFSQEAHEVINLIATVMQTKQPYTVLRDQMYTHPTMAEGLNDVLGQITIA
nr:FAD-dependent oxidoreductase [Atopobacter phocae]